MAGIGIRRTKTVLIDGNDRITLSVSQFYDGVADNATRDIYADGTQRVIEGFATENNIVVTCQKVDAAAFRWLTSRISRSLLYSGGGITFVGSLKAVRRVRNMTRGEDYDYDLRLEFLVVTETVNDYLERTAVVV